MVTLFYKNHLDKSIITSTPVNFALLIARSIIIFIKLIWPKQKHSRQTKNKVNKQAKT